MKNVEQESQQGVEYMPLPELKIGKHRAKFPIISGGMGVGVSTAELAGAVAREGGIGTLSAAAITMIPEYREYRLGVLKEAKKAAGGKLSKEEARNLFKQANIRCIKEEIRKAKEISQGNGAIFINIMVATKYYDDYVKAACEAGVDGIVSGAGLPSKLPRLTAEYPDVAIVPIVSSEKAARVITGQWNKSYEVMSEIENNKVTTINGQKIENREGILYQKDGIKILPTTDTPNTITVGDREYIYAIDEETQSITLKKQYEGKKPDAVVVESVKTGGGHLGAVKGKLSEVDNVDTTLEVAVPAVVELLKQERIKQEEIDNGIRAKGGKVMRENIKIPVIAAGGIVTREDIDEKLALGAEGVQIGTVFATTKESNAHQDFKDDIINAEPDKVGLYNSNACYPARYLIKSLEGEDLEGLIAKKQECLRECLNHCALRDGIPGYAQICIEKKLVHSTRGSNGKGLKFIGWPFDADGKNKIRDKLKIVSSITVKELFELRTKKEPQAA